jgi:ferredoxin
LARLRNGLKFGGQRISRTLVNSDRAPTHDGAYVVQRAAIGKNRVTPEIMETIRLTVNGRSVEVQEGSTLLDATHAAGVHVPTLCHYPRLPSHAVCRMCLVDVGGQARPQPACVTRAQDGDVVETDS